MNTKRLLPGDRLLRREAKWQVRHILLLNGITPPKAGGTVTLLPKGSAISYTLDELIDRRVTKLCERFLAEVDGA